jgi:hypothetical protein
VTETTSSSGHVGLTRIAPDIGPTPRYYTRYWLGGRRRRAQTLATSGQSSEFEEPCSILQIQLPQPLTTRG